MRSLALELQVSVTSDLLVAETFPAAWAAVARGEVPADPPSIGESFAFNLKPDGVLVAVDRHVWRIRAYADLPTDGQLRQLVQFWHRLRPILEGASVAQANLASQWIESYPGDWRSLLASYVAAFFAPGSFPSNGHDCSILIDARGDGWQGQLQTGPMTRDQLAALNSGVDLPQVGDNFLYVAYDYSVRGHPQSLDTFITEGLQNTVAAVENQVSAFTLVTQK